jgi:hypothetical protein
MLAKKRVFFIAKAKVAAYNQFGILSRLRFIASIFRL